MFVLKIIILSNFICTIYSSYLSNSVEELSKWLKVDSKILDILNKAISDHENNLLKLQTIRQSVLEFQNKTNPTEYEGAGKVDDMLHPVEAFVKMRKLMDLISELDLILEEDHFSNYNLRSEYDSIDVNLPTVDDLFDVGLGLLRLQKFYDLDTKDIIKGRLLNQTSSNKSELVMDYNDCFELGKIAYDNEQYNTSIQWFEASMDQIISRNDKSAQIDTSLVGELLDYTAFALYKIGQVESSAAMTRLLLNLDPENERALENLKYYEEELLEEQNDSKFKIKHDRDDDLDDDELDIINGTREQSYAEIYKSNESFNTKGYQVIEDDVVKSLCQNTYTSLAHENTCSYKQFYLFRFRTEQLYSNPKIIRVYDIITEQEAKHIRKLASTRLFMSTVQSSSGNVITKYRVAKTAWLKNDFDSIVKTVNHRLSGLLNFNLRGSEELQVVNYGLGGYYGPHLDAASRKNRDHSQDDDDDSFIKSLMKNDRLATILIYLNRVEVGGSTVFPKLNLTIEPIERSAVIWYNIDEDGLTDERTLHSACPVLLGSKWIATKWPREKQNTSIRQCDLKSAKNGQDTIPSSRNNNPV